MNLYNCDQKGVDELQWNWRPNLIVVIKNRTMFKKAQTQRKMSPQYILRSQLYHPLWRPSPWGWSSPDEFIHNQKDMMSSRTSKIMKWKGSKVKKWRLLICYFTAYLVTDLMKNNSAKLSKKASGLWTIERKVPRHLYCSGKHQCCSRHLYDEYLPTVLFGHAHYSSRT